MSQDEIKTLLASHSPWRNRTLVVVDFGNVEKWKHSLGWSIDLRSLGNFVKHLSVDNRNNRRFYYGTDNGPHEKNPVRTEWSRMVAEKAQMSKFEYVTKVVKYIHKNDGSGEYDKKCDLDVEMAVDLIKHRDQYDHIYLFSGDGDLMYAVRYMKEAYHKRCTIIAARDHIGREVIDALQDGTLAAVLYAQDLQYRLRGSR